MNDMQTYGFKMNVKNRVLKINDSELIKTKTLDKIYRI